MSDRSWREEELLAEVAPEPSGRPAPGKTTLTSRLHRKPGHEDGVAAGADAVVEHAAGTTGAPLPDDVRARFEASLGADLGGVRTHTGGDSAAAASAVGAQAYTVGQDIHFGEGKFAPADPFGLHLLAHEVAHTVQQQGGTPERQHKLEVSSPGDRAEVEADRAADAMVAGQPAAVSGGPTIAARAPDPGAAAAAPAAGDTAVAPGAADEAVPQGGRVKVTVVAPVKAANKIEFDAENYAELYRQISLRAQTSKCAGQCDCGAIDCNYVTSGPNVIEATFTTEITTSIPSWKQKASQPKPHQDKFDAWVASVKVHEAQHVKIYQDGLAKLKTQVVGPTSANCDTQSDAVIAAYKKAQDDFDADKSKQPAPLDIPGGTSKIGPDGKETPISPNAAGADGAAPATE